VNGVQDGTDIGALGVECSSIDRPILNWTNSGFENGFIDWDYFPSDINEYADVVDEIAYEGSKSLKIIPYTGDGYYARVGKDYYETDAENLAGRTIHLEAQFFTSSDDLYWLGGDTLRFLAMYFDQGWMEIQADYSENFDLNVNNWNYKNLVTTVPSNAQNIIFGINATGDESVGSIYVDNFTATLIDPPMISSEIFFSEYSEGSGNNKYLEIYNGSSETINLDDYVILSNYNGNPWSETFTFVPGATLESRDVYVICFGGADESILEFADEVCPWLDPWRVAGFNGDDARALASAIDTNIIIDIIGTLDGDGDGIPGEGSEDDPGGGWEVAGVYEATKNHTMVRKASIYEGNGGNWASSAGTSENNSEWIVYEQDYWENLGWHSSFGSNLPVKDGLGYDIDWTNITNELSANWLSNLVDGAVSFEYAIGIFPVPSTEIVSWTSTGTDTFFTQTGLSLVEGATYYSHIRRVNSTSQPIDTVSSDGVTIDLTAPVIDAIYEGDISEDMDFQQSTDYLTLAWSGMDVTSGIDKYEYAWGTTAGADDIVAWFATNEQSAGDTVLSLQDGSMYFGSVRGTDAAGNQSNTLTGNGLTIDASQPIGGMVIDGDSIDLDFTSSTTTLTASWSGFTDEGSGISEYHYAIGTEPGETQNVNWVSVGTDSLVTNSTLTLISGITYYVSVRATDSVGNEGNTVYTNGITIDTQPPSTGNVNDGPEQDLEITSSTNTLSGNWTGFNDALSGIAFYEYAIDTISGGTDLVSWTNTGLDSNFTEDDLNLQNN
ncbi:MAG: lamin tail domain-containing protein, partial [Candidatus Neomarinimicrobiota bacterium]